MLQSTRCVCCIKLQTNKYQPLLKETLMFQQCDRWKDKKILLHHNWNDSNGLGMATRYEVYGSYLGTGNHQD
eukprot:3909382-Amphidinium_carterae.1